MTTNDLILLNQLLDWRMLEIGEGLEESEYFETFSAEQALKDDDLSYDEIRRGGGREAAGSWGVGIDDASQFPKTKAGRLRYVALIQAAVEAVTRLPKVLEYVFYNPDTLDRWFDCHKPWEAARKKAGYGWLKVKDLRTAFGIRLANIPGLERHTIQTLLGHSSPSTTERFYAFHSHRLAVQRV
jgi:integrase